MVHPEPKIPFQGNSGAAGWGRASRVNFESRMRDALGGIKPMPTWGIQKGLHKLLGIIVTISIPSHPFRQFKSTKYVSRMDTSGTAISDPIPLSPKRNVLRKPASLGPLVFEILA